MSRIKNYIGILIAILLGCFILLLVYFYSSSFTIKKIVSEDKQKTQIKNDSLLFIGDVMLGRFVENLMIENGNDYPFSEVSDLLKSNITIANLEGTIPKIHEPTPINGFTFSFRNETGKILNTVGIKAVSLANNHSMDKGIDGYNNTKKVLDDSEIGHFGAYSTTTKDYFETKLNSTPVVVFGINMISDSWNEKEAIRVAKLLRSEHLGTILVAYIHWGNEYDHAQGNVQKSLAHELVDSGVDVIIGSHPHVTQGIEKYKDGIIFYSLGNFVFDQYFSNETQESYGVTINLKNGKPEFGLIPFVSRRSKVYIATSTQEISILKKIASSSVDGLKEEILLGKIYSNIKK